MTGKPTAPRGEQESTSAVPVVLTGNLYWQPDPLDPLVVHAVWTGPEAAWRLDWGDGHSDKGQAGQRPIRHAYDAPGARTLTVLSEPPGVVLGSAYVVIRDTVTFTAHVEALPDRRGVRVVLGTLPDPVDYQIEWGDGAVTRHGRADLSPTHTYTTPVGAPTITVTDLPTGRRMTLIGPDLTGQKIDGFYIDYLGQQGWVLRGGGIKPGSRVMWHPWQGTWTDSARADAAGQIHAPLDINTTPYASGFSSYTVRYRPDGATRDKTVFVPMRLSGKGSTEVVFDIDQTDPWTLTLSMTAPVTGKHTVDYGDGVSATFDVGGADPFPLRARHAYGPNPARMIATITTPDGVQHNRRLFPTRTCTPAPSEWSEDAVVLWWWSEQDSCGTKPEDEYCPVIVDDGLHVPVQVHPPLDSFPRAGYKWSGFPIAGDYHFRVWSAIQKTADHLVPVSHIPPRRLDATEQLHIDLAGGSHDLGCALHIGDVSHSDRYTAWFDVANLDTDPDQVATGWEVRFTLAEPAEVSSADSWRGPVTVASLGAGRWVISSHEPIPAGESARVNIRVDHPGVPTAWPTAITAVRTDATGSADSTADTAASEPDGGTEPDES